MTVALPARAGVLTDVACVWWRETLTIVRDPFSLIFSLLQPLVFLGLFGPLLSGLAGGRSSTRRCGGDSWRHW
jgi:ABC-2 type transport system permease protein